MLTQLVLVELQRFDMWNGTFRVEPYFIDEATRQGGSEKERNN
jgi:hypothetical protein